MSKTTTNDNVILTVLPQTVETALQAGVPAPYCVFVSENFDRVLRFATTRVASKFKLSDKTVEPLALEAVSYTLAAYINGTATWPHEWKQWAGMAQWKTKNLVLDLLAKHKKSHVESYDARVEEDEGELSYSPVLQRGSFLAWHEAENEAERQCRIRAVRYAIPKVVGDMRGQHLLRNFKIVRAVYVDGVPTKEVTERFGITENHLSQILFTFRAAFAASGPRYMKEYLAA